MRPLYIALVLVGCSAPSNASDQIPMNDTGTPTAPGALGGTTTRPYQVDTGSPSERCGEAFMGPFHDTSWASSTLVDVYRICVDASGDVSGWVQRTIHDSTGTLLCNDGWPIETAAPVDGPTNGYSGQPLSDLAVEITFGTPVAFRAGCVTQSDHPDMRIGLGIPLYHQPIEDGAWELLENSYGSHPPVLTSWPDGSWEIAFDKSS